MQEPQLKRENTIGRGLWCVNHYDVVEFGILGQKNSTRRFTQSQLRGEAQGLDASGNCEITSLLDSCRHFILFKMKRPRQVTEESTTSKILNESKQHIDSNGKF